MRYTVYNTTDTSALFTVNYSINNGSNWKEPDYASISVPAGSMAIGTVYLPASDVPMMLRIKQTTGLTDQPCYIDNIALYYEGPEVPDFIMGDVNGDGEVSIKDVSALIDYLLSGDSTGINLGAADVKPDGEVSIGDVSALIDILLED